MENTSSANGSGYLASFTSFVRFILVIAAIFGLLWALNIPQNVIRSNQQSNRNSRRNRNRGSSNGRQSSLLEQKPAENDVVNADYMGIQMAYNSFKQFFQDLIYGPQTESELQAQNEENDAQAIELTSLSQFDSVTDYGTL